MAMQQYTISVLNNEDGDRLIPDASVIIRYENGNIATIDGTNPVITNENGQAVFLADDTFNYYAEIAIEAPINTAIYGRQSLEWVIIATRDYLTTCGDDSSCGDGSSCGEFNDITMV